MQILGGEKNPKLNKYLILLCTKFVVLLLLQQTQILPESRLAQNHKHKLHVYTRLCVDFLLPIP